MREDKERFEMGTDDVERLLAQLEPVPPPPDLPTRVFVRTTRRARVRWGVWVALAVSVGVLTATLAAVSGYLAGRELVQSGAYDLVRLLLEDWELVALAPAEYGLALAEVVPWTSLLAMLASIAAAYAATRPLARAAALFPTSRPGHRA